MLPARKIKNNQLTLYNAIIIHLIQNKCNILQLLDMAMVGGTNLDRWLLSNN